ncbi:MAG TPA: hypothetical protein VM432_03985 [Bdellovibrionales bacterium]|nr:hypothetical protein [Bdellovibrionales bacterium]
MIRLKLRDLVLIIFGMPVLLIAFNNCAPLDASEMNFSESVDLASEEETAAQAVLKTNDCNNCHGTRPGMHNVYLYDTQALIDDGYLVPGSPASSEVYINTGGGHNGVAALSSGDRATIATWINSLSN